MEQSGEQVKRKREILVVDNDSRILGLYEVIFKQSEYRIIPVQSHRKAMKKLADRPGRFSLIISDLNNPVLRKDQLLQDIRAVDSGVPVMLVSGYVSSQLPGVDGFAALMKKPFNPVDLRYMVDAIHGVVNHPPSHKDVSSKRVR